MFLRDRESQPGAKRLEGDDEERDRRERTRCRKGGMRSRGEEGSEDTGDKQFREGVSKGTKETIKKRNDHGITSCSFREPTKFTEASSVRGVL